VSEFFSAHRKFFVSYLVGALVFLVAWLILGSLFGGTIAASRRSEARARREAAQSLPPGVNLRDVQQMAAEVTSRYETLAASLHRKPERRFTLEGVTNPDLHYNRLVEELQMDVLEKCALRNIEVDESLGRPGTYPTTAEAFTWYLRGLDVVHQFLRMVIEADDLYEGGVSRIEKLEIGPPPKGRRGAADLPFLQKHDVTIRMVAHPRSVAVLLEQISRQRTDGQGLILMEADVRSLDVPEGTRTRPGQRVDARDQEKVEARLRIASVDVDPNGRVDNKGNVR
jgi:hypothetical protein